MVAASCCKSQVHLENTEEYDEHHDKCGDAIDVLEYHNRLLCCVPCLSNWACL